MMLVNDDDWVNGDIGTVYDLGPDFIKVELKGCVYKVEPHVWEDVKYEFNPLTQKLEPSVKGFLQTVSAQIGVGDYDSQGRMGLTFDNIYFGYRPRRVRPGADVCGAQPLPHARRSTP